MSYYLRPIGKYIVLITCFGAGALLSPALAREEASLLLNQPARSTDEQPAPPPQQEQAAEVVMPAPAMPNGAAHPAPPIKYHASRSARRVLRGGESVELLMVARNPADSSLYEIPLYLPACCVGEPTVVERSGLRGRGVVEYCWPCGFSATVKFRHRLGDVKVEYDGD